MKKRLLSTLMALVMVVSLFPTTVFAEESDNQTWDGSADTTWYSSSASSFTISTAAELAGLAALVNAGTAFAGKTITLGDDIDLAGYEWTPIGDSSSYSFQGTFDGNGYEITNMTIDQGALDSATYLGLFGYVARGTVKNVDVTGTIAVSSSSSTLHIGGVVGSTYAQNGEITVRNCSSDVDITVGTASSTLYVGGLVGYLQGHSTYSRYTTLDNCYATGDITVTAYTGSYATSCRVGGLAGYAYYAYLYNCYSAATVSSPKDYTGTLVGSLSSGTVDYCYYPADTTAAGSGTLGTNCDSYDENNSTTTYSSSVFKVLNEWVTEPMSLR